MFCNVMFVGNQSSEIFGKLRDENSLQGLSKVEFIKRLSYYFGEVNALHPFREGNGRTQREFFRELVISAGHEIDYSNVPGKQMLDASIDSFMSKYDRMVALFKGAVIR